MKRKRENYEKNKNTLKLGDSSASQKQLVPLSSSGPSKSPTSEAPLSSGSRKILSSLPQPPPIISPSKPTISIPIHSEPHTSETHNSEPNTSSSPLQKCDLTTIKIHVSEAILFNEPISSPSSTPYYGLTSDSEHSDVPDPTSHTLALLQATTESKQTTSVPETSEPIPPPSTPTSEPFETLPSNSEPTYAPSEPISEPTSAPSEAIPQNSEPDLTLPTLNENFAKFSESTTVRLMQLSEESRISDNPSEVRTHWNGFLRWMTSGVFKLKGISEQVKNEERAWKEAEEKAKIEAEERAAEAAAAEAEAKAKVDAEEDTRIAVEEAAKTYEVALTQSELSTYDLAPLVLKTLEGLQKE